MNTTEPTAKICIPPRILLAVRELLDRMDEYFTGSITIHFQGGIIREIEQHTRKRLKKQA